MNWGGERAWRSFAELVSWFTLRDEGLASISCGSLAEEIKAASEAGLEG